jgi:hypothetical protein
MSQPPEGPPPQGPPPEGPPPQGPPPGGSAYPAYPPPPGPPSYGGPPPPGVPPSPPPSGGGGGMSGRVLAVIIGAVVVVVAGVVAAVALTSGDDEGAADDNGAGGSGAASVEEICDAYTSLGRSMLERMDLNATGEEQGKLLVEVLNDWAAEMDDIDVPDEMPARARDGLELLIGTAADLEPGDISDLSDLDALEDEFSADEKAAVEAFEEFTTQTCDTGLDDLPTQFPTDLLTELPSGLPSDFPTEIPSEYLTLLPSGFPTASPTD